MTLQQYRLYLRILMTILMTCLVVRLKIKICSLYTEIATCCFLNNIQIQSKSIIVESIIVENSIIVDDLPATEDFYSIKIQNSRNSKIVELFLGKVAWKVVFSITFWLNFQQECLSLIWKCHSFHVLFSKNDYLMLLSIFKFY